MGHFIEDGWTYDAGRFVGKRVEVWDDPDDKPYEMWRVVDTNTGIIGGANALFSRDQMVVVVDALAALNQEARGRVLLGGGR